MQPRPSVVSDDAKTETPRPGGTMRIGEADVLPSPSPAAAPGACAETVLLAEADVVAPPAEPVLKFFGDYTVLGEIARGGMGVVYLARHRKLNRTVALKMIRPGALDQGDGLRRFRIEAEAAANLDHPNIVPIYELGEHEGRHYFSMKMVEGESLHDFNAKRQPHERGGAWLRNSAMLMVKISRAVQHAHERAILHRDLKPRNILIDEQGEPHITDFGLAKVIGQTSGETMADVIMGTPHYMSPEQAAGKTRDVTTLADVYSLGAVLFELLVGTPPFQADTMLNVMQQVRETPAPNPAQWNAAVPRDLATICLKCLEKEPHARYASAQALADELERWLAGESILARPSTPVERVTKWVRRNPRLAGALGVAALSLVLGTTISTWGWRTAAQETREKALANQRLELQRAEDHFTSGNGSVALATLARVLRDNPANRIAASRLINALNFRQFLVPLHSAGSGVSAASFAGDQELLLTGAAEQDAQVTRLRPGAAPVVFRHGPRQVLSARLSADGRILATGSDDGLRLWDAQTGTLAHWLLSNQPVHLVAFVPAADGESLIACTADSVVKFPPAPAGSPQIIPVGHADVMLAATSARSDLLALATESGHILVLELRRDGAWQVFSNAHASVIRALAFSGDQRLVSASSDAHARVWDLQKGREDFPVRADGGVLSAEFSGDNLFLATAGGSGTVQLWDALSGRPAGALLRHPAAVNAARFSPDGRTLVTACEDGITRLWSATHGQWLAQTVPIQRQIMDVQFGRGGRAILSVADGGAATLYGRLGGASAVSLRSDAGSLRNFATPATSPRAEEMKTYAAGHADEVTFADVSPDGLLAATASADRTTLVWKRANRQPLFDPLLHEAPVNCARFSADGTLLATSTAGRKVRVWDAQTGQPITDWIQSREPVSQVWLSPDAAFVITDQREVWPLYSSRERVPAWLPDLAEAVAGLRLTERRVEPLPPGAMATLRARLAQTPETNALTVWSRKLLDELP